MRDYTYKILKWMIDTLQNLTKSFPTLTFTRLILFVCLWFGIVTRSQSSFHSKSMTLDSLQKKKKKMKQGPPITESHCCSSEWKLYWACWFPWVKNWYFWVSRSFTVLKKDQDKCQFLQMGHIITYENRKQLCTLIE